MAYSQRSVFKGASIYSAGQLLTRASTLLLIPLYTRFLTITDYGIIGYLEVIVQVLVAMLALGFYAAQSRYYYEAEREEDMKTFLFSANLTLVLVGGPICAALTFWGEPLFALLGAEGIPFHPFVPMVLWTAFFQVLGQMVVTYHLAAKAYRNTALLQVAQFALVTGAVVYLVVFRKQGAVGKVAGTMWGHLLFFLIFYPAYLRRFRFSWRPDQVAWAVAFGLPLVMHILAAVIHQSIDRVILEQYITIEELGIYTLGYQAAMVMSVIVQSVNRAWSPNFYDLMRSDHPDKKGEVRRTWQVWLVGVGLVFLIGALWAREILRFLTPPSYHAASRIVPLVLFGYVLNGVYFFFVAPLFYFKRTRAIPVLTVTSALLNIGLNYALIPRYGSLGAAWATAASFTWLAAAAWFSGRRLFDPGWEFGRTLPVLLYLLAVGAAGLWEETGLAMQAAKVGVVIGYVVLGWLLFRDKLRPALRGGLAMLRPVTPPEPLDLGDEGL